MSEKENNGLVLERIRFRVMTVLAADYAFAGGRLPEEVYEGILAMGKEALIAQAKRLGPRRVREIKAPASPVFPPYQND